MYIKKYEAEKRFQTVMENIAKLGYDTSDKSNIRELFKELLTNDTTFENEKNNILNSLNFENRKKDGLDSFFNFFGIRRIRNFSNSHASIDFMNNAEEYIRILKHTFLTVNGENFLTTFDQEIPANKKATIFFTKTDIVAPDYEKFDYNNFSIEISNLKIFNEEINKKNYLKNNISIFNFKNINKEEPDELYSSRAKMILQTYGDSNLKKIKDYIIGIQGVSDVLIKEQYDKVIVIVVPEKIMHLDRILKQANEAVEYFATAHIELKKPTIMEISVTGIYEQLLKWFGKDNEHVDFSKILNDLCDILNLYVKKLYFENKNELSRDMLEFLIDKYFSDNQIYFSLNEEKVNIEYKIFTSDDYNVPIIASIIKTREEKELLTDVTLFKEVL